MDAHKEDGDPKQAEDTASDLQNADFENSTAVFRPSVSPSEYTRQGMIIVHARERRTPFRVHKALAAAKIPYFCKKPDGNWNDQNKFLLDDVSEDIFGIILHWTYEGNLPITSEEDWPELYQAADFLMIDKIRDELLQMEAKLHKRHDLSWRVARLRKSYDLNLHAVNDTRYYENLLKSAVGELMPPKLIGRYTVEGFHEIMAPMMDAPAVVVDMLRLSTVWARQPWPHTAAIRSGIGFEAFSHDS